MVARPRTRRALSFRSGRNRAPVSPPPSRTPPGGRPKDAHRPSGRRDSITSPVGARRVPGWGRAGTGTRPPAVEAEDGPVDVVRRALRATAAAGSGHVSTAGSAVPHGPAGEGAGKVRTTTP